MWRLGAQRCILSVVTPNVVAMMSSMWTAKRDYPGSIHSLRLRFYAGENRISYHRFLCALIEDESFRELVLNEMRLAPYVAFRWETPPLDATNIEQPFECLLHDSPELEVPADPTDFESYFQTGTEVVSFQNLGGDATLVVPCPISESANYSHIGAFHRSAPLSQQHALWIALAKAALARIGSLPVWLSTAGGGVDWLHLRMDDRPKYYRHSPWRNWVYKK